MKRKLAAILLGCMTIGLLGCGSDKTLSDSTKELTAEPTEDDGQEKTDTSGQEGSKQEDSEQVNSEKKDSETAGDGEDQATIGLKNRQFAVKLLQETYKEGENEMIAPLSVLAALTMTENGAKGDTLTQMEQVLSGGMPVEQQGKELSSCMKNLPDTENAHLNIANSIWLKDTDTLHVEDDFLKTNTDLFDAEIFKAPFDDSTLKDINKWVSDKTDKMIPEILNQIENDSVMYLINAVAFDAKWQSPYEKGDVQDGTFISENGGSQSVDMMYSTEDYYLEDDSTTGFIRPYAEGYSFVALLPKEGISMSDYISQMSAEKLVTVIANASTDYEVDAAIPKFKSEYAVELNDTLKNMGMTDAFDPDKADFSGIGTSDRGNLYIDMVLHKTYIEVDEQGTKAGAATVVGIAECTSLETPVVKTVHLDRPFVYAIIDNETQMPVFLGVTETITQ